MSDSKAGLQAARTLVVVINWNGDQDLIDCLDSLETAKADLLQGYDMLVLDNASTTGAIGRIEAEPGLRLVDAQGQAMDYSTRSFDHFAPAQ